MMYFDGRSDYADNARGRDRARGGDRYPSYPMHQEYDYEDGEDFDMRRDREMDMRRRRSSTTGRYMRDRNKQLPEENLEKWIRSLMSELEEKDRQQLKMDSIIRRAKEMGISFEKFTEEELYVTVLMLHTDLSKAFGPSITIDHWIKGAKAWLCDPDASVRYGKKLAAYYENIVEEDDV